MLLYEIAVCLLYAFFFGYDGEFKVQYEEGDVLLVSGLAILAIIGFGLVNTYITNSAFSGMSFTLLIFALSIQHYFLFRAFWYKAGAWDPLSSKTYDDPNRFRQISYVNEGEDLQNSYALPLTSFVDAIACSISLIVAFSSFVGRVATLEIFFLTIFGSFLYEVNSQLMWRFFITDTGYGMRIFIFGSFLGLISALILGKRETTFEHRRYLSIYSSQSFGLIGFCCIFCAMPFLSAAGLYRTSTNDSAMLWIAPMNMWFSLISGVLGSFCISTLTYGKTFLHDLVFGGIAGGIAFSSSSDLHRNPAAPMAIGFITGFLCSLFNGSAHRKANSDGVFFSLSTINRYLVPGIFSCIFSAILHALGQASITGVYADVNEPSRTFESQGAYQLIGFCLSAGIGMLAGVIIGLLMKLVNGHEREDQFDDDAIFTIQDKRKNYTEKI